MKKEGTKINSNTILFDKKSQFYGELEALALKIASQNQIENVSQVKIAIDEDDGIIEFEGIEKDSNTQRESDYLMVLQNKPVWYMHLLRGEVGIKESLEDNEHSPDYIDAVLQFFNNHVKLIDDKVYSDLPNLGDYVNYEV